MGEIQDRVRNAIINSIRSAVGGPGLDWTMDRALRRAAGRTEVATIIDIGASNGIWTKRARRHFPNARALLIEAQGDHHEGALSELRRRDPSVDYVISAAGNRAGEIHFSADDPFSGAASNDPFASRDIVVPMTTVDAEVATRQLAGPFLLKLDTHGFEAEILDGASTTLRSTAVLIVEAYNFELRPGVMRFHDLVASAADRGFRPVDLADPMRRPRDGLFWQVDLIFMPSDRPEFGDATYG